MENVSRGRSKMVYSGTCRLWLAVEQGEGGAVGGGPHSGMYCRDIRHDANFPKTAPKEIKNAICGNTLRVTQ